MKFSGRLVPLLVVGLWLACDQPEVEPYYSLEQIDGCSSVLARAVTADSCFTYLFDSNLIIDFCVTANCCPDSDRFVLSADIISNNISITVQDTAADLCRCICPYLVHAEFCELPLDDYLVRVLVGTDSLIYEETVQRSK